VGSSRHFNVSEIQFAIADDQDNVVFPVRLNRPLNRGQDFPGVEGSGEGIGADDLYIIDSVPFKYRIKPDISLATSSALLYRLVNSSLLM